MAELDDRKHTKSIKANFTEREDYDILRDMAGKTDSRAIHLHSIVRVHLYGHKTLLLGDKDFSHLSDEKTIPLSEMLGNEDLMLSEREVMIFSMLGAKKGLSNKKVFIMAYQEYLLGHVDRLNKAEALYNQAISESKHD